MSEPQPFPWQTDQIEGNSIDDMKRRYDDAIERAKRAASVGQWGVESSWQNLADKTAHELVIALEKRVKSLQGCIDRAYAHFGTDIVERVADHVEFELVQYTSLPERDVYAPDD